MIQDEHFVPLDGLDLTPYIEKQEITAVHHLIRYAWAIEVVASLPRPKRLLDVACGGGYGSYLLAQKCPHIQVTGADYDPEAILYASQLYNLPNLVYVNADVTRWQETLGSTVYDCIISFDTIEHVPHREIMMENLIEHLNPRGIVLLSTPCGADFNDLQPKWPAHRIEYSSASLFDFLSRYFHTIQRPDNKSLPKSYVFDQLNDSGISYLLRLNPVLCKNPIKIKNPYKSENNQKGWLHLLGRARSILRDRGISAVIPAIIYHLKWRYENRPNKRD